MNGPFMLTIAQKKENAYCKECSDYVSTECMLMSIVLINREMKGYVLFMTVFLPSTF